MLTNFLKIKIFHKIFGRTPDPTEPDLRDKACRKLRADLVFEEFKELIFELGFQLNTATVYNQKENRLDYNIILEDRKNIECLSPRKVAKEASDLLYVTYGTGASLGLDLDHAYDEVHNSNMSKLGPSGEVLRREDGKVLKGPHYKPPDLEWLPDYFNHYEPIKKEECNLSSHDYFCYTHNSWDCIPEGNTNATSS